MNANEVIDISYMTRLLITAVLSTGVVTTLINILVNRSINKATVKLKMAEIEKIKKEALKLETDIEKFDLEQEDRLSDFYKKQFNNVLKELKIIQEALEKTQTQLSQTQISLADTQQRLNDTQKDFEKLLQLLSLKDKEISELKNKLTDSCVKSDCPSKEIA